MDRTGPASGVAFATYAFGVDCRLRILSLPALTFRYGGKKRTIGDGPVEATVSTDRRELLRVVAGRRSRSQIEALEWTGNPAPYPGLLPVNGERLAELVESWGQHQETGLPRTVLTERGACRRTWPLLAGGPHSGIECRVARSAARRSPDPAGDRPDRQGDHEEAEDASDDMVHISRSTTRSGWPLVRPRRPRAAVVRCAARSAYRGR
jgi:hypothetical protein